MIILAVGLVVAAVCVWALFIFAESGCGTIHGFAFIAAALLGVATGLSGVAYVWQGWNWIAAEQKANIINREYGANYTREEVYFASDVIDTVRQLDRKRIEVNGDLMRAEKDK
mgnify:FL=1